MNKPLRRIAIFCGVLILALLVRTNYLQYVRADELNTRDENRRVRIERYAHERGDIIVDGKAITGSAVTKGSDFKYKRVWKNGPMWAPVTGYSSQAFDASQLESLEDGILTGNDDQLFFDRTLSMFTGEKKQGGNVVTTLNAAAQKAAFQGLGDKKGAVAAIDPQTGAILALASTPSYDPSTFAGNSDTDTKAWQKLLKDKDKPMLNRALRETYPPGSTFKVVTAAAALENGLYTDIDGKTDSPLPYRLPQVSTVLQNEGNIPCENASLREALRMSCNTVFGKISDDLGNQKMMDEAASSASTRRSSPRSAPTRASTRRTTGRRTPWRASARRPTAPLRCRWPWSPPRSPTTASSCSRTWSPSDRLPTSTSSTPTRRSSSASPSPVRTRRSSSR